MHAIQRQILEITRDIDLSNLTLRQIGEKVGVEHPQKIKHHLNQLIKRGLLKNTKEAVIKNSESSSKNFFISLPIYGSANCGEATLIAEENLEGYLQVSKSLLNGFDSKSLFVIKAVGNSLNKADIKLKNVENGDYLLIDCKSYSDYDGKYVLSIINGMANVKKFLLDDEGQHIILFSESTETHHPIYIHKEDFENYLINGVVVDVIKSPKNL